MTNSQIAYLSSLERLFQEGNNLVFWNDPDSEFISQVDQIVIEGVNTLRLDQISILETKLRIELDQAAKWLIYAPFSQPEPKLDWLLDARLRGKIFSADTASMQLDELGLGLRSLRDHIKARAKFFNSKDRIERLKRLVSPEDTADVVDQKMIATLLKSDTADAAALFLKVFSTVVQTHADLETRPDVMNELASFNLENAFWDLAFREFEYRDSGSEPSNLRGLLYSIFVTDFCLTSKSTPPSLSQFVIKQPTKAANASVFANWWRLNIKNYETYDKISNQIEAELHIANVLNPLTAEELVSVMTFESIEKRVIGDLKSRILNGHGANMDSVRELIARRRDGHWANPLLANSNESTKALSASYDALEAAATFFELQAKYSDGLSFKDSDTGFKSYMDELYKFDQLYRRFMKATDAVEPMGWALLHELKDQIENSYSGWYIGQLSSAWGTVLEGTSGLLSSWKLLDINNQYRFYERYVAPALTNTTVKRVFVVISDAFRYEAAQELVDDLNSKTRLIANLDAMLGVLPSYTSLGMASLLPHNSLAYKSNTNLDVLIDGKPSSTLEQRSQILSAYEGVAIGRDSLMEMGREKAREFIKDYKVVYIYHDQIDNLGDKQSSEAQTFEATSTAIREISEVVGFIVNSLNSNHIFITADHGFLYQDSAVAQADKTILTEDPPGLIKSKKRYALGRGMGQNPKVWSGNTEVTANTDPGDGSIDFWAPKGAGRFHFVGGARFVHGSCMPQEIVVPVVLVKESRSESAKSKTVEVSILGSSSNKVVTNKQRFEFIQTQAVSDRVLPVTLVMSLRDGDKLISDEQALTFDSDSQNLDERKRSVMLTLAGGSYDSNKDYFLVARDAKTKAEAFRITVRIDLAFSNDF